jgi:hypothetical protein
MFFSSLMELSPAPNFGILLLLRKPRFMLRVRLIEDDILTRVLAGFSTNAAGETAGGDIFFRGEAGGVNGDLEFAPLKMLLISKIE